MSQHKHRKEDRASDKTVLETAGIPVYSDESVRRYMADQLASRPPGLIVRHKDIPFADTVKFFACVPAGLGGLMAVQQGFIPFPGYQEDGALSFGAEFLSALACAAAAYIALNRTWCRPPYEWRSYELREDGTYVMGFRKHRVPPSAQELLRGIRKLLPDSAFSIRVLGLDPVIICSTPRENNAVFIYGEDGRRIDEF